MCQRAAAPTQRRNEIREPVPVGDTKKERIVTSKTESLEISKIRMDGGTQARAELHHSLIDEYAQAWPTAGPKFPPVIVFHDGKAYWLADGFHRVSAAQKAGDQAILADVRDGDKRAAILYACGANADHGLRRTDGDMRRAVEACLRLHLEEAKQPSNYQIAQHCHVDESYVRQISKADSSLRSVRSDKRTYTTKHGTQATMDVSRIGRRPGAIERPPAAQEKAQPSRRARKQKAEQAEARELLRREQQMSKPFRRAFEEFKGEILACGQEEWKGETTLDAARACAQQLGALVESV